MLAFAYSRYLYSLVRTASRAFAPTAYCCCCCCMDARYATHIRLNMCRLRSLRPRAWINFYVGNVGRSKTQRDLCFGYGANRFSYWDASDIVNRVTRSDHDLPKFLSRENRPMTTRSQIIFLPDFAQLKKYDSGSNKFPHYNYLIKLRSRCANLSKCFIILNIISWKKNAGHFFFYIEYFVVGISTLTFFSHLYFLVWSEIFPGGF